MQRPQFHAFRGETAVQTLHTLAVTVWFHAAGAAVLTDRAEAPRATAQNASLACATPVALPEMHERITVEAHRG
jgi:hypothetical protein